jgi:hypothetical protein
MDIKKHNPSVLLAVLIIVIGSLGFYFYNKATALKANPNTVAQKEATDIIERAGKLILLPQGETPVIASVTDPEKLRDQAFFAKAKIGYKALFYQNSGRAYLYDPVANRIIAVAVLSFGTGAQASKVPTKSSVTTKKTTTQ